MPEVSDADKQGAVISTSFGAAGNIILLLSQSPMIWQLMKEGDASKYTWLPSLSLLSTFCLWGGYTAFVYSPTERVDLYVANFSGVVIPFVYLCIFVIYSKTGAARLRISGATLLSAAVTWGFVVGLFMTTPLDKATNISGGVVTAVNMTFFISPLKAIYEAILTLDASRLPATMSVVQVFQSLPWVATGVLLKDYFILGVNATGEAFAIVQLLGIGYIALRRRQLGLAPGQPAPWLVDAASPKDGATATATAAAAAGQQDASPSDPEARSSSGSSDAASAGVTTIEASPVAVTVVSGSGSDRSSSGNSSDSGSGADGAIQPREAEGIAAPMLDKQ